jgi:hypothetical protein
MKSLLSALGPFFIDGRQERPAAALQLGFLPIFPLFRALVPLRMAFITAGYYSGTNLTLGCLIFVFQIDRRNRP